VWERTWLPSTPSRSSPPARVSSWSPSSMASLGSAGLLLRADVSRRSDHPCTRGGQGVERRVVLAPAVSDLPTAGPRVMTTARQTHGSEADDFELELELRRLAEVVWARADRRGPDSLSVSVGSIASDNQRLRGSIRGVISGHFEGDVEIEVTQLDALRLSGTPAGQRRPARVRLLGVYAPSGEDEVEVHLGYGGRTSVGRSRRRPLVGAAHAAMSALRSLGADLPYEIEAIARLGGQSEAPLVVVLRTVDDGGDRMGIVRDGDDDRATVRALLHALNRHLEQALSATSAPDASIA